MNEEIKEIISKMDYSLSKNDDLINSINKEFSKVTKVQGDINSKLESITKSVNDTLKKVHDSFEAEVHKVNKKADDIFFSSNENTTNLIDVLEKEKLDFTKTVKTLIDDVNNKTAQVQEFSDGVAKIQKRVESVLKKVDDDWGKNRSEIQELLKNIDIKKLLDKMQKQDSRFDKALKRITKLEKHSHTHIFGGQKV